MEDKKILYIVLALVGGIMVGYMTGGSKISVQDQGAASLSSRVAQESLAVNQNLRTTPTTSQIYPEVTLIYMDAEEMSGQGSGDPTGVFVFKFKVKAINGDVYIANDISALSSLNITDLIYSIEKKGYGQINQNINAIVSTNSWAALDPVTNNYHLQEGDPEVFTVTATVDLDMSSRGTVIGAGDYRGVLNSIKWNASNSPTIYVDYVPNFITDWLALN